MTERRTLSVIVPAYCEADNIVGTLDNITRALAPLPIDYELLVIDDGSTDGTGALVTRYADRVAAVRLLTNDRNRGFGWTYRRGVDAAAFDHIVMVHGDNAWGAETLREFFAHVGDADIIVGYTRDMWSSRSWPRTATSKTFTGLVNLISGRRLQYYNGLQIHRADVLKSLSIQSSGYGFQAEVLVKALRRCKTFIEVGMTLIERQHGESKAFRWKNAVDVARTISLLWRLERGLAPE
jgi:glycosyltransferase involved in cell wall biosynthesis